MAHLKKRYTTGPDGNQVIWRDKQGRPRWYAQVFAGRHPTSGKPQFVSRTFVRESEAKAWIREQEGTKDQGGRPATTRETLAEYLQGWLRIHATQVRSIYNYEKTLTKWVLNPTIPGTPLIGGMPLRKLTVKHFDGLYAFMQTRGLTRGISYLHGILRTALSEAVRKEVLTRNPAAKATVPKPTRRDDASDEPKLHFAMTRDEATAFLAAARPDRLSALWHLLLTTGLRPGEAFALRWVEDVDLDAAMIHVRHNLTWIDVDRDAHPDGWMLTAPKTERSRRSVPIPALAVRELREWRKRQLADRLKAGQAWRDLGFVFTTPAGAPLGGTKLLHRAWKRVLANAELGEWGPEPPAKPAGQPGPRKARTFRPAFRLYALRHTHATLALLDGEDLLIVSRRLGHTTIKLTADTYGHVTAAQTGCVADRFDRMFGSA